MTAPVALRQAEARSVLRAAREQGFASVTFRLDREGVVEITCRLTGEEAPSPQDLD